MILVIGHVRLAPGEYAKAGDAVRKMVAETRKEEGCLDYILAPDPLEPDLICITERWVDEASLAAHGKTPHMAEFGKALAQAERISADVWMYTAEKVRKIM